MMKTQEHVLSVDQLISEAIELLRSLIAVPSFSAEEDETAGLLRDYLVSKNTAVERIGNNIIVRNKYFDPSKPSILLNSHHDTVKPNAGYILDPFLPFENDGKLFGLGSNDAGGALVSLIAAFLFFYERPDLKFNLIFVASAEEEISGRNGIEAVLGKLGKIDFAIVGEPTQMNLAIAEKGLLVLDCCSKGKAGHAAREEGENAIYRAIEDIQWIRTFQFPARSETLGAVKMSVTMINAGSQHNVVPGECRFTVDVRTTDVYSNAEILAIISSQLKSEVKPRSTRLNSSSISGDHPFIKAGMKFGRACYGSPTLSDQALMPFPSVKIGPGDSSRSHTADEFIYLHEIEEGVQLYINLLREIL